MRLEARNIVCQKITKSRRKPSSHFFLTLGIFKVIELVRAADVA